uniref:Uncharacterized protein n=1 Tax=Anopheles darlingi TaxID=43151 RepID=A0A158N7M6_ANODA
MSEVIELRREQSIREYECMKHLKLFTDEEIAGIKTKRLNHEYKTERRQKNLVDFINYIAYEKNVLQLLRERRRKLHVNREYTSLEGAIHKRIRVLYKRALARFPSEYRLWEHFVEHCRKHRKIVEGSEALAKMLNYHGDKPKAWIRTIEWEYRKAKNMHTARHFAVRGLQRHPTCGEIHLAFIGIQMAEATKLVKEAKETAEEMLAENNVSLCKQLESASLVYENYEHKDVAFFAKLLEQLSEYRPLSNALAERALEEMRTLFADNSEEMWNILANLALDGNAFLLEGKDEVKVAVTLKQRLNLCIETFREGLDRLKTKKLYSHYIETMLKLNATQSEDIAEEKAKRKALAAAFRETLEADQMEEEKLIQYLKLLLLNDNPKEELIMNVINKGLQQFPHSSDIWTHYLRYLIQKEAELKEVERVFQKAVNSLDSDKNKLPVWKMLLQYFQTRPDLPDKVEKFFLQAIQQSPSISHHFQPLYLDFLLFTKNGITEVRKEYNRLVKNFTTTLDLHQKMASLEAAETQPNVTEWRKCLEQATHFYGKTTAIVWLDYIRFEIEHGSPRKMQTLYERAKGMLDEETFGVFLPEYELLKNPLL